MWACVFMLIPAVSAYAPVFHYSFAKPLPDVRVSDGVALLHEPERWADGAGLLLGIPRFRIRKVSEPLVSDQECMVRFEVDVPSRNGKSYEVKSVLCVARGQHECRLKIMDRYRQCYPTHIAVRVTPFSSKDVGLLVTTEVTTCEYISDESWEAIQRTLPLCLGMCNKPPTNWNMGLDLYRQHIHAVPIQ